MARTCEVCGKGPHSGHSVSFSNRHTKRRFLPNLQRVRVRIGGSPRRMVVCTACLKAGRVKRAV